MKDTKKKQKLCSECMKILNEIIAECTDGMFHTVDWKEVVARLMELIT